MTAKEIPYFVLELLDLVCQVVGKPLPCHLQRKLDRYSRKEDTNLTLSMRRAAMIYINDSLLPDEIETDSASKLYESSMKKLLKNFSADEFLKLLSLFAYGSAMDYSNHKQNSPDTYFVSMVRFMEKLKKKFRIDNAFWKNLDQFAITLIQQDSTKFNFKRLNKTKEDLDMSSEKGFVLHIMTHIFDMYCRNLPDYLQPEYNEYKETSSYDPKMKNAVQVILNEVLKKARLVGGMDPIILHYYNLACFHFSPKYFMEFCVCCSKMAMIEYLNESKKHSPKVAYELLVYIINLAKEDGKFSSLEEMDDAASKILEDDDNRVEHQRARRCRIEESSGSNYQVADESDLIGAGLTTVDCKCCTLN